MAYYDLEHQAKIEQIRQLWGRLDDIEALAAAYQITDIAQDNNLKLLQTLVLFDFQNQPGREGADAIDRYGHAWELKTVNVNLTRAFSTNHHTNHERIAAFRQERWLFSVYKGILLQEVYAVSPRDLEDAYFSKWWEKSERAHINNPKIPLAFVKSVGVCVYPFDPENPKDPAEILKEL